MHDLLLPETRGVFICCEISDGISETVQDRDTVATED